MERNPIASVKKRGGDGYEPVCGDNRAEGEICLSVVVPFLLLPVTSQHLCRSLRIRDVTPLSVIISSFPYVRGPDSIAPRNKLGSAHPGSLKARSRLVFSPSGRAQSPD